MPDVLARIAFFVSFFIASIPLILSLGLAELPTQKGPYRVGTCLRRLGKARVRLFYPCPDEAVRSAISWLPTPLLAYMLGYGVFARLSSFVSFLLVGSLTRVKMSLSEDENLCGRHDKFPLMLFSHGIGSNCTTYSSFAAEMASHGIVVATIEHRDKSAASTVDESGEVINYQHSTAELLGADNGFTWRQSQQKQRVQETFSVVHYLLQLTSNNKNTAEGTRSKSLLNKKNLPSSWRGKLDFENVIMAGHSFGGATAVAASAA